MLLATVCFQAQFIMIQCINQKLHWTMFYFYVIIFRISYLSQSGALGDNVIQVRMLFQNLLRFQELWVRFFFWQFPHPFLHRNEKEYFCGCFWVLEFPAKEDQLILPVADTCFVCSGRFSLCEQVWLLSVGHDFKISKLNFTLMTWQNRNDNCSDNVQTVINALINKRHITY